MGKVKHGLPHCTAHDLRRTARTHQAALGLEPHVSERCLKHKLRARAHSPEGACGWRAPKRDTSAQARGVEGIYNRHDDFEERRRALEAWGQLLLKLERQGTQPKKLAAAHQQALLSQEA